MSTLDRLREIVKPRSSVPVVADDARLEGEGFLARHSAGRDGGSPRLDGARDIVNAALTLGGAVIERTEGAVIVVDREYRAGMLHGRIPIGEIGRASCRERVSRCV